MISPFREVNSEGEYLHVQASGFRDTKFPAVIFRPKKRSGIAVRVGERIGTWQAKRPTTHKYRVKRKETGRGYFIPARRHNANGNISGTMKCVCRLSPGTHQDGTRASLAPNSAYYSFCFRPVRRWRFPDLSPCCPIPVAHFVRRCSFPSVSPLFPSLSRLLR